MKSNYVVRKFVEEIKLKLLEIFYAFYCILVKLIKKLFYLIYSYIL